MKYRRQLSLLVYLLIIGCWLDTLPTLAAQNETPLFQSEVDYAFGQRMRFRLTAENLPPIQAVTLFFRAPEFPNAFTVNVMFEPGMPLVVEHTVDLTQLHLAPFTRVTYWWLLTTNVGEDIRVPEQVIIYEDDQFMWRTLGRDDVTVHWTGEDAGLGQLALDIAAETRPHLAQFILTAESVPLSLYLYPTSADLRSALRLTGRDWVGAHAHPELGVILVTAVNARTAPTDLRQSIPHEMVHFLLYQATGAGYDSIPVWFNEGLATYVEAMPNPNYDMLLATAVANRTTIPFTELCATFPATEEEALLAYAQSVSLIRYIQASYGNRILGEFVNAFADGADCRSGTSRVLELSLEELNRAWLRTLQPRSPVNQFWHDNGVWLLLLAGGFIITSLLIWSPSRRS